MSDSSQALRSFFRIVVGNVRRRCRVSPVAVREESRIRFSFRGLSQVLSEAKFSSSGYFFMR